MYASSSAKKLNSPSGWHKQITRIKFMYLLSSNDVNAKGKQNTAFRFSLTENLVVRRSLIERVIWWPYTLNRC